MFVEKERSGPHATYVVTHYLEVTSLGVTPFIHRHNAEAGGYRGGDFNHHSCCPWPTKGIPVPASEGKRRGKPPGHGETYLPGMPPNRILEMHTPRAAPRRLAAILERSGLQNLDSQMS